MKLPRIDRLERDLQEALDREAALRKTLEDYAEHQSWRCGHPDRYPWDPDCPCGLVAALAAVDIKLEA